MSAAPANGARRSRMERCGCAAERFKAACMRALSAATNDADALELLATIIYSDSEPRALAREESRGGHYRSDFPTALPPHRTFIRRGPDGLPLIQHSAIAEGA